MQDQTIVLAVDYDGNDVTSNETWSNFDRLTNKSIYHSDAHTPILRDEMDLYRTMPKETASYYGTQKAAIKFSSDEVVSTPDGSTTRSPGILQLSGSRPVGFSDAGWAKLLERVRAAIQHEDFLVRLFSKGEI